MNHMRRNGPSQGFTPSCRPADPHRAAAGRFRKAQIAWPAPVIVAAALLLACTPGIDSAAGTSPTTTSLATATVESVTQTPALPSSSTPVPTVAEVDIAAPFVADGSIDDDVKRMNVTLGGKSYNIKNGGTIVLGDGYAVEIYVDPFPPSTLRTWMDLYLTLDGEPVTDASMGMEYDMLAMLHGPFWGEAEKVGEGHYLFVLDYIMFGPWDQMLTIRIDLKRIRFPIVLVSYP